MRRNRKIRFESFLNTSLSIDCNSFLINDQKKVESLEKELELLKEAEARLKVNKEDAEKLEGEMKAVEKQAWDEFRAKVQQHQETREAADAFSELDVNKDGR